MSIITEITALRHQGNLKEAYQLAKELLRQEPGEWANMAMFWVLRDIALQSIASSSTSGIEKAQKCLDSMKSLQPEMVDSFGTGIVAIQKIQKALVPNYDELKILVELSKTEPCQAYDKAICLGGPKAENLDLVLHEDFGWILYRYFKARLNELSSLEVRGLLCDYIMLKNKRPSMLHSMILNFAISFAKNHADFQFPAFLELWGLGNFRDEDLRESSYNGETMTSIVCRVCGILSQTDNPLIEELSEKTGLDVSVIVDMHRKQWFWNLFELQKTNCISEFWTTISSYVSRYGTYDTSKYHSEILRLATRKVDATSAISYADLICSSKKAGIFADDWLEEKGKDGNLYPPFVVQLAKKCFMLVKENPQLKGNADLLDVLADLYGKIEEHKLDDEWISRQRAILSIWRNDRQDAASRYRELLAHMGDKYYIWQEAAQCVDDSTLRAGFLLHALELEKNEDLIGHLRLQLANILLEIGYPIEARGLLDAYAAHRLKQGKKCTDDWVALNDKSVKITSQGVFNSQQSVKKAMDYAYVNYPWQDYVLVDRFFVDNKPKITFSNGESSFAIAAGRFGITNKVETGTIVRVRAMTEDNRLVPLMIQITDAQKWAILPERCGYVVYVNEQKSMVSVVTSKSEECFFFDRKNAFNIGDFLSFKCYNRKRDKDMALMVVNPVKCLKKEVLCHFKRHIVVVDDVNNSKALFHIVLGVGLESDIVRFKDTTLRPKIGDFLNLTYCTRNNKEGKKRIIVLDLQTTNETNEQLIRNEIGDLTLKYKFSENEADFGFVNDMYASKQMLQQANIYYECSVRAKAVVGSDGKWKIFNLQRV